MTITTAQIRGARGILGWSQSDLSERTGISATSIGAIENGSSTPRESSLIKIRTAFETGGIEFIGREGVKVRTGDVRTYKGRSGFWQFYQDIYETLLKKPGEVLVSNVDERDFEKWLGEDNRRTHVERMQKISGVSYKIIIKEGDDYYLATDDYAKYKWLPKSHFTSVPFYVYGDKLAIMLFDNEPTVITISYPAIAQAYRVQFETLWALSQTPPKYKKVEGL